MNYWLDLFTGTTWKEFLEAGGKLNGFNLRMRNMASKIQPGDILLCYLTGVKRWVGALRVIGPSQDKRKIWSEQDFPVRFEVEPVIALSPEHGIPMEELEGKVAFYRKPIDAGKYRGFIRSSPRRFDPESDGEYIIDLLQGAKADPQNRPVDPKKLARKPLFKTEQRRGKKTVQTVVSVPESEPLIESPPNSEEETLTNETGSSKHTEIQYNLLALGAEMGFDVWVARNDRSRAWNGQTLGEMSRNVRELPTQFNEATNRTIELIDVLWLQGNAIIAAFEVESTTSIYSGLLRMSDLLALQPNLEINLFLVAPEERRSKVEQEILRPTFMLRPKPICRVCGFIGFSQLLERIEGVRKYNFGSSLKPDFLNKMAEYFTNDDEPAD